MEIETIPTKTFVNIFLINENYGIFYLREAASPLV